MKYIKIENIAEFENEEFLRFKNKSKLQESDKLDFYASYAVYVLWYGESGFKNIPIYIGKTGNGKSIIKRLRTHVAKLRSKTNVYEPENWKLFRERQPSSLDIKKFEIGYNTFKTVDEANFAEVALLAHVILNFDIPPECNREYVHNHSYKEAIKKIIG